MNGEGHVSVHLIFILSSIRAISTVLCSHKMFDSLIAGVTWRRTYGNRRSSRWSRKLLRSPTCPHMAQQSGRGSSGTVSPFLHKRSNGWQSLVVIGWGV